MNFVRNDVSASMGEGDSYSQTENLSAWSLGSVGAAEGATKAPATFGHMHLLERGPKRGLHER